MRNRTSPPRAASGHRWAYVTACILAAAVAGSPAAAVGQETKEKRKGDVYPLENCPVSGKKLGSMGEPVIYRHEGRELRLCCRGCLPRLEENMEQYLKQVDAKIRKTQKPYYPLENCPVSGQKLGSMGDPVDHVVGNRLVRLCCSGCVPKLEKEVEKYLKQLDKAVVKQQKPQYPLETCVVSGAKLGSMGEPVDYVVASRLVRFCCKGCLPKFASDPSAYLEKIRQPLWTCSMHPEVRSASPGKCPVCKMGLLHLREKKGPEEEPENGASHKEEGARKAHAH